MSDYTSNTTFAAVAARLKAADRIALTTHGKPDGDAMGSVLALHRVLSSLGKQPDILLVGPVESSLVHIADTTPYTLVDERSLPGDEYDLVVLVDTGAWSQLEPLGEWFRHHHEHVIGIDHHARGDAVASARIVDVTAAATTQVLAKLIDELGAEITGGRGGVAEALFVGLATDTGWFRFESAGPETYRLAARLLAVGVDKGRLYELIEETHEPVRLELEARALASLEYLDEGRIALQVLGPDDFAQTGGRPEHLTGIVNMPMAVGAVRVSVLLTEAEPGCTKISFRSKPATDGFSFTNVNEVAARLGGGGHVCAAGARVQGGVTEARRRVISALAEG